MTEVKSRVDYPYVSDHFPVEFYIRYRLQFRQQEDPVKPVKFEKPSKEDKSKYNISIENNLLEQQFHEKILNNERNYSPTRC